MARGSAGSGSGAMRSVRFLTLAVLSAALLAGRCAAFGGDGPFAKHLAKFKYGGQGQQQQQQQVVPPTQPTPAPAQGTPAGNGAGCPSVIEVARQTPNLSVLVAALEAAGLAGGPLADRNAVQTVFAPTNAAFAKLAGALGITQAQLLARKDVLAIVLPYHVVPGVAAKAATLTDGQRLTTLRPAANLAVRLEAGGRVRVVGVSSRAAVVQADVPACKSVVHVIDTVLLPQPLS